MEKKYKLTEESINVDGRTLYRIEALKDFDVVKKGDKGGFIEKENNLSQKDNCWVYGNAKVYDDAEVSDNAVVCEDVQIYGNVIVCGNARVFGNARVYNNAKVCGNTRIYGDALVCGNAMVRGDAVVYGYVMVFGDAMVYEDAEVFGNAKVYGNAWVCGYAEIRGNAEIATDADYIVFKNWWSSGRHFTWTKSNNMWKVGCFYGTGKELIEKAYKDSKLSGREYERVVKYVESILKDNNTDV